MTKNEYRAVQLSNGKFALQADNGDGTWRIVDAVTFITEAEAVAFRDRMNEKPEVVRVIP
jgi:hypothetical protein